jgi:hypothetical protein
MQIDPNDYKQLVAESLKKFNELNTELTACKLSFFSLKSQCVDLEQRLDAAARNPSHLQRATAEECDSPLGRFLERSGQALADLALLQRLQALNASGPIN